MRLAQLRRWPVPERDHELIARLDALGERASVEGPPVPAGLAAAVAARASSHAAAARQPVPRVALAAAAAVVLAGAGLVVLRAPVVTRGVQPGASVLPGGATLLAMTERFSRAGSIDAALDVRAGGDTHKAAVRVVPVYRAFDARSGQLPE